MLTEKWIETKIAKLADKVLQSHYDYMRIDVSDSRYSTKVDAGIYLLSKSAWKNLDIDKSKPNIHGFASSSFDRDIAKQAVNEYNKTVRGINRLYNHMLEHFTTTKYNHKTSVIPNMSEKDLKEFITQILDMTTRAVIGLPQFNGNITTIFQTLLLASIAFTNVSKGKVNTVDGIDVDPTLSYKLTKTNKEKIADRLIRIHLQHDFLYDKPGSLYTNILNGKRGRVTSKEMLFRILMI